MTDRRTILLAVLILAVTAVLYAPVLRHGFILLDDPDFVTNNPIVLNGISSMGVMFAFDPFVFPQWQPLTWLSLMLDAQLYGMEPAGFHTTNLLLHLATTVVLFLAVRNLTGEPVLSCVAVLIWAIHPLHVESVAWISERKGMLSSFFFALTLWQYERCVRKEDRRSYLLLLLTFTLGLMSKSVLVTLPFGLMLLDIWPLRRGVHLKEKIPMIFLSFWAIIMNYISQDAAGVLLDQGAVPGHVRAANVIVGYGEYLRKLVWPDDLCCFYPLLPERLTPLRIGISLAALMLITILVLAMTKRGHTWAFVGWCWYLGTILPVIGILQIGRHAMADRYSDLPMLGIYIAVIWTLGHFVRSWKIPIAWTLAAAIAAVGLCLFVSHRQVMLWKSSRPMYEHCIAVTHNNYPMLNDLALVVAEEGEYERAIKLFEEAIAVRPAYGSAHNNFGNLLLQLGRDKDALKELKIAARLRPRDAVVRNNLGRALLQAGDASGAIAEFESALRLEPTLAGAHRNAGAAYLSAGNRQQAIHRLNEAIAIDPHDEAAVKLKRQAEESDPR